MKSLAMAKRQKETAFMASMVVVQGLDGVLAPVSFKVWEGFAGQSHQKTDSILTFETAMSALNLV